MFRNRPLLKAVAMAIYVKKHTTSSLVKAWSVNRLHQITGLSATTIKKRLPVLFEQGFITYQGRYNEHLLFVNLKSSCNRNNIDISNIKSDTVKDIEKSLTALLVVLIQKQKEYARLQLQHASNGKTVAEIKHGMRERKRYGWHTHFVDHGLSYARIARRLGVSLRKAFDSVAFGLKCGFFTKASHFIKYNIKGASNLSEVPQGFTFISKRGYLYKVYANTYSLSPVFNCVGNN